MRVTTTSPRIERSPHLLAQKLGLSAEARALLFAIPPLIDPSVGYASVTLVQLAQGMAEAEGRPRSIAGVKHHLDVLRVNGIIELDGPDRDGSVAIALA